MVGRCIVYGLALLATLALQPFYDGYLAQFLLICVVALPLLSLLLSLRGVLGLRLSLSPSAPQLTQGEEGHWQVTVTSDHSLPISRLVLTLSFQNVLTGQNTRQRISLNGLSGGVMRSLPMDVGHCGLLICQLHRAKALDFLGLFAFPVSVPDPAHALVLPAPVPMESLPDLPQAPSSTPSQAGTPSMEDYELREYRPGDPLRTIHWKLSSKHNSLVVRESVKGGLRQAALTFDFFGDGERLDQVLGRVWATSAALLRRDTPHHLLWLDPNHGQQERAVATQAQLTAAMAAILSRPAPRLPSSAHLDLSHLSHVPHVHITPGEEDAP